jgi:3'-5' exonuclease
MATVESQPRLNNTEASTRTAFLVVDTESVPDGRLLNLVKYTDEQLNCEEAIEKARAEARDNSWNSSDFVPVAFQFPVAVCVVRVGEDFSLQAIKCIDAPLFRPREIVRQFWLGVPLYERAQLVTYNGRCFDMPLLELAAFRYGIALRDYLEKCRKRFSSGHLDLCEWMNNYGAVRLSGGLDLLAKLLGKPGKMEVSGDKVYELYRAGKHQEINDYCLFDTLDTYFVFLRTRVLVGEITLEQEAALVAKGRAFLGSKVEELPALKCYLDNWGDWQPWP